MNLSQRKLIQRYLIWCYKTTKESLDRVDRYYTQLAVDDYILRQLKDALEYKSFKASREYKTMVDNFEQYKLEKKQKADKEKFTDEGQAIPRPEYQYLRNRLSAIEKAIVHFLGGRELKKRAALYEEEMIQRIMTAREHT